MGEAMPTPSIWSQNVLWKKKYAPYVANSKSLFHSALNLGLNIAKAEFKRLCNMKKNLQHQVHIFKVHFTTKNIVLPWVILFVLSWLIFL